MNLTVSSLICICIIFISCSKEEVAPVELNGDYIGKFIISEPAISYSNSGDVTLFLSGTEYTCSGNTKLLPAGGGGTFKKKEDKLVFDDKHIWDPQVDLNHVLRGEFSYSYDQNHLILWKSENGRKYEYDLTKR